MCHSTDKGHFWEELPRMFFCNEFLLGAMSLWLFEVPEVTRFILKVQSIPLVNVDICWTLVSTYFNIGNHADRGRRQEPDEKAQIFPVSGAKSWVEIVVKIVFLPVNDVNFEDDSGFLRWICTTCISILKHVKNVKSCFFGSDWCSSCNLKAFESDLSWCANSLAPWFSKCTRARRRRFLLYSKTF